MSGHTFNDNFNLKVLQAPATQGSFNSSWENPFTDGNRSVYLLVVGATTENVSMKLTQATSSGGAGAKDITGAAIAAITSATDNVAVSIEIAPGALDPTPDSDGNHQFKYVRAEVTVASAGTTPCTLLRLDHNLRYHGFSAQHATYSQQVQVL